MISVSVLASVPLLDVVVVDAVAKNVVKFIVVLHNFLCGGRAQCHNAAACLLHEITSCLKRSFNKLPKLLCNFVRHQW